MPPAPRFWTRPWSRYKADRLWNINANILVADLSSTAATAAIIELLQARLSGAFLIVTATAAIDGVISLAAFACLYLFVNRERGVRDLFRVQVHRWVLSPFHYLVGSGMQLGLMAIGARPSVAALVAYWSAVAITRAAHTLYGKRSGLFR